MAFIFVLWVSFWVLWQSSYFRWATFHGTVGILNYGIAFVLYAVYGVDKYIATTVGHMVHVYFGYFYDRDVSFQVGKAVRRYAFIRYWTIEAISFSSIILTIVVMVDLLGLSVYLARFVVAMIVSSVISYGLNYFWTFEVKSRAYRPAFCFLCTLLYFYLLEQLILGKFKSFIWPDE